MTVTSEPRIPPSQSPTLSFLLDRGACNGGRSPLFFLLLQTAPNSPLPTRPANPFHRPTLSPRPAARRPHLPSIRAAISRSLPGAPAGPPETTKLLVAKNTLVFKAIEGTPWEALRPCMKGMNAWLFVHTEEIPGAIKPYRDFVKEKKLENNDFSGGVFEGQFYGPDEFKVLESMPTRAEVYAKLLGALQSPGIGLVGTLQAPAREVVMVLQAFVKKLEEESGGQ
ncbi:hypothetical protein NL676_003991 [Syzygium grande]|nr:hypothetical protein NL676_003991 [Syzygium grande]